MFCEAQMIVEPIHQIMAPIMIDFFLPRMSERYPETSAPTHEPPGIAAVIPPWVPGFGPPHLGPSGVSDVPVWLK